MRQARMVVFQGEDGWRWHLKAANGRIVASSGEAFTDRWGAERAASTVVSTAATARLEVIT
jgi:uncharacterized protein YegP (UPF0339 family)